MAYELSTILEGGTLELLHAPQQPILGKYEKHDRPLPLCFPASILQILDLPCLNRARDVFQNSGPKLTIQLPL